MNKNFEPEDQRTQVEVFTQPEHLEKVLKKIHVGAWITKKKYITNIPGYINDMEWNFYDELHRYHVHNTYQGMFKIFSVKTFPINLVKYLWITTKNPRRLFHFIKTGIGLIVKWINSSKGTNNVIGNRSLLK